MKKYISPVIWLMIALTISIYSIYSTHFSKQFHINKRHLLYLLILDFLIFLIVSHIILMRKKNKVPVENKSLQYIFSLFMFMQFPVVLFYASQTIIDSLNLMSKEYIDRNIFLFYLIFLLLIFLLRNVRLAAILMSTIIVGLTLVIYYVYLFRGSAVMLLEFSAIQTAADVAGGYEFAIPIKRCICLSIVILELICYSYLPVMDFNIPKINKVGNLFLRACLTFGCVVLIYNIFCTNIYYNDFIEVLDVQKLYREKGGMYILFKQVKYIKVDKPEGYSKDKAKEILQEASNNYNNVNNSKESPVNIIYIMNESFSDFEDLGEISTDNVIIPYIKNMKNVSKGFVYVPVFGAGTCNSEYEALTGRSTEFFPEGCKPFMNYCRDPEYGIANTLKNQGYSTIALHPSSGKNWNRNKVYEYMQFDQFVTLDDFTKEGNYTKTRGHITDQCAYEKVESILDNKEEDQKMFLFCVTIQNHGGYTVEEAKGYEPSVSLNYQQDYPLAEMFLSLANDSDEAFKNLVEHYENSDEKTMIVMFGDHYPYVEQDFFTELSGKTWDELNEDGGADIRRTPYIIWTNYKTEDYTTEDISSNYLGVTLMQKAGLKLSDYDKFLLQLKAQLPVISCGYVIDAEGNRYSIDDLPAKYQKLYNNYKIIQYNAVWDRKNVPIESYTVSQ